jgi:hypothetical protein
MLYSANFKSLDRISVEALFLYPKNEFHFFACSNIVAGREIEFQFKPVTLIEKSNFNSEPVTSCYPGWGIVG